MSWNKNSAKVIGITAAAAMALSLAPATAFTAYAAPRNGSSVSEQAVTPDQAIRQGYVSKVEIDGVAQTATNATHHFKSVYNKQQQTFIPTQIQTAAGVVNLTPQYNASNDLTGLLGSDGRSYSITSYQHSGPGTAIVRLYHGSSLLLSITWDITSPSLDNATIFNSESGTDTSNKTFTYNGRSQKNNIGIAIDGNVLRKNIDYTIKVIHYGRPQTDSDLPDADVTDAGHYSVIITGLSPYYSGQNSNLDFTIQPLDLSKADVAMDDTTSAAAPSKANVSVNGHALDTSNPLTPLLNDPVFVSGPNTTSYGPNGTYQYKITPASSANPNITGVGTINFSKIAHQIDYSDVTYDGHQWMIDADSPNLNVNLDDPRSQRFNPAAIAVRNRFSTPIGDLESNQFRIVAEKEQPDGSLISVDPSQINNPGTYHVRVVVIASATDYTVGGQSEEAVIHVTHAAPVNDYVSVDGKLITNSPVSSVKYNGKDFPLSVKVTDGSPSHNVLTEGTDYTVSVKKGAKTVSAIHDAGEYTITINLNNGYHFPSASPTTTQEIIHFIVNRMQVHEENVRRVLNSDGTVNFVIEFKNSLTYRPIGESNDYHNSFMAYQNGNAIVPVLRFVNNDNGDEVNVPASAYKLNYYQQHEAGSTVYDGIDKVTAISPEHRDYRVSWANDDPDGNFLITGTATQRQANFRVTSGRDYEDVPNNVWYSDPIAKVTSENIMHGYNGTKDFGPLNHLTRGEAAQVIFNIALQNANNNSTDRDETRVIDYKRNHIVKTPFKDVNTNAFYATPVAWASANKIITGYLDGSHTFKPNQNVSRQEFAAMLQRYASKLDGYKAGDESVLDSYTDRSQVAPWAVKAVTWAVANNEMGQNTNNLLHPTANIIRAEVAAIISRSSLVINNN